MSSNQKNIERYENTDQDQIKGVIVELQNDKEIQNLIEGLISALSETSPITNVVVKIAKVPFAFRDAWYWSKFKSFLSGISDIS